MAAGTAKTSSRGQKTGPEQEFCGIIRRISDATHTDFILMESPKDKTFRAEADLQKFRFLIGFQPETGRYFASSETRDGTSSWAFGAKDAGTMQDRCLVRLQWFKTRLGEPDRKVPHIRTRGIPEDVWEK